MVKVTVFCLTLAFSRRKFYWPGLNEIQASIFEAIESALHHFGGSPKQLLVFVYYAVYSLSPVLGCSLAAEF